MAEKLRNEHRLRSPGGTEARRFTWSVFNLTNSSAVSISKQLLHLDAGHGLYALRSCKPSTKLFRIPAKALINSRTLASSYPGHKLTAVQLVSLHLALNRPQDLLLDSKDSLFGPYLSTLPRDFSFHPLYWLVVESNRDVNQPVNFPPSVQRSLEEIRVRFDEDWKAVCQCKVGIVSFLEFDD